MSSSSSSSTLPDGSPRVSWVAECQNVTMLRCWRKRCKIGFGDLAHGWPRSVGGGWGHDLRPAGRCATNRLTNWLSRGLVTAAGRTTCCRPPGEQESKSQIGFKTSLALAGSARTAGCLCALPGKEPWSSCFRGSRRQTEAPQRCCPSADPPPDQALARHDTRSSGR